MIAQPRTAPPWYHAVPGDGNLVLAVNGSKLYTVTDEFHEALTRGDDASEAALREMLGETAAATEEPALRAPSALTLNVAQACNLACSYCYAQTGDFGSPARLMSSDVALALVDAFVRDAPGPRATIGFIGGEPFVNRRVMREAVDFAKTRATERGLRVGFGVTTNATLLDDDDLNLLRDNAFSVTVSLDGSAALNDATRATKGGGGSWARVVERITPLLDNPGNARVAARATVTRRHLSVRDRVEALCAVGFGEVGVAPVRTSPDTAACLTDDDWPTFLRAMIEAADDDWSATQTRNALRFSNFAVALKEIHRGTCRPLPCGSAVNYVSASAKGEYYTCHRTVEDKEFLLGSVGTGLDEAARLSFVRSRSVDNQEPCRTCWARYLCGGGCHAEVLAAGRGGCDYIRGWLEHCLRRYDEALEALPWLFAPKAQSA